MNLPQINTYCKNILSQIRSTHKHLTLEETMLLCGWIGVTAMKSQIPAENRRVTAATNIVAQMLYVSLLNDEEYKQYQEDLKNRGNSEESSTPDTPISDQAQGDEHVGGEDSSSNQVEETIHPNPDE